MTATTAHRDYEAMFLLDNVAATEEWEATSGIVDTILEKHGAEIVHKEKWDERKLAYEIDGHRRATYYLVYFRGTPSLLSEVSVDLKLNEKVIRHLVIRLEEPMDVHIEKRAVERERLAEDSRKTALSGWGDRRKGGRKDRDEDRRSSRSRDDDDDDDDAPRSRARSDDDAPRSRARSDDDAPRSSGTAKSNDDASGSSSSSSSTAKSDDDKTDRGSADAPSDS